MTKLKHTKSDFEFQTERLTIKDWSTENKDFDSKRCFAEKTIDLLSPNVTKSLPDGWQNINSIPKANQWIFDRANESDFLLIKNNATNELVGFIFLYKSDSNKNPYHLRFGYLLSENEWGKGLGTELIEGLVAMCKKNKNINSLSGGVEKDNFGSIKVMEKNGFLALKSNSPNDQVIFYEIDFTH